MDKMVLIAVVIGLNNKNLGLCLKITLILAPYYNKQASQPLRVLGQIVLNWH